jgi:hypothetical protein
LVISIGRIGRIALAAAALALPTSAWAGDFHYYNKPGVSKEAYMADVGECEELAGGARPADIYMPYQPNLIAAGVTAFFGGMMRSAARRRMQNSVVRTCMADKGYARMEVDDKLVDDIEKMKDADARVERLFALAAASEPLGKRVKE